MPKKARTESLNLMSSSIHTLTPKGPQFGFTIGVKLAVSTVVVLSLVTVLVANQLIRHTRQNLIEAKAHAAAMIGDLMSNALVAPLDFSDATSAQNEVDSLKSNRSLVAASAFGTEAQVAAQVGDPKQSLTHWWRAERGDEVLTDSLRIIRPIVRADGRRLGTLVMLFSLAEENKTFVAARRNILWFAGGIAALTTILLVGLSRWQIVGPLDRLVSAARRLGKGDHSVRVRTKRRDEIGRLAQVFDTMSKAIVERETNLEMARRSLRELFDNMRQAIVAFGPDGKIENEASRQAVTLFGELASAGTPIEDLLYGNNVTQIEYDALEQWVTVAFDCGVQDWPDLVELAPKELWITRANGERKYLRLEFRPVVSDNRIVRIMLLATDETELKILANQVRTQEQDHARQIAGMRRMIAGGGHVFVRFIELANERVQRCREILQSGDELKPSDVDEMMQHVHTIKGESRAFDLKRLADAAMTLEDELASVQARARSEGGLAIATNSVAWRARLMQVSDALTDAQETFVAASPIGRRILDQVTVSRTDIARLEQLLGGKNDEASAIVQRLAARPFGEIVASLVDRVPGWAESTGKRANLDVEGREVMIPPDLARVLPGVVTHLVRNAIAHGIESPSERVHANKPELGTIRAICMGDGSVPIVVVEDDGRGVDFDSLASRAGLSSTNMMAARELLFAPGVSTISDATELAGRGMGLSAVRAELGKLGWVIDIDASRRAGTAFVIRPGSKSDQAIPPSIGIQSC